MVVNDIEILGILRYFNIPNISISFNIACANYQTAPQ